MSKLYKDVSIETLPLLQKMFTESSHIYSYRLSNNSTEARDKLAALRNDVGLEKWELDLIQAASIEDVAYFSHCFVHVIFLAKKQGLFEDLLDLATVSQT